MSKIFKYLLKLIPSNNVFEITNQNVVPKKLFIGRALFYSPSSYNEFKESEKRSFDLIIK